MQIKNASLVFDQLVLGVVPAEAEQFLQCFKAGEYDIKRKEYKRTRNANAYAWVLMSQIGERLGISAEEVYKHQIANIGGRTQVMSMPVGAVDDFKRYFVKGHIGRSVAIIGTNDGVADVLVTLGSSDYNTAQMSQLIDNITQECHQLGIETLDDMRMRTLIESWNGE